VSSHLSLYKIGQVELHLREKYSRTIALMFGIECSVMFCSVVNL